jgi:hypothetical protein
MISSLSHKPTLIAELIALMTSSSYCKICVSLCFRLKNLLTPEKTFHTTKDTVLVNGLHLFLLQFSLLGREIYL